MAFIDGSATVALHLKIGGLGTEDMTSTAPIALTVGVTGDLIRATRILRAKATSNTRIRVDFTAPVDNNVALITTANWRLFTYSNSEFQPPTILSVEVPTSAGSTSKYVILVVSEMYNGAQYVLAVNSVSLVLGPNLYLDSDMTSPFTMTIWTSIGVGTVLGWGGTDITVQTSGANVAGGITQDTTPLGRCYTLTAQYHFAGAGVHYIVQFQPPSGPPVVLFEDDTGGLNTWNNALNAPNTALFYQPGSGGQFQFMVVSPTGSALGAWTNITAQAVHAAGESTANLITSGGYPVAKEVSAFIGLGIAPVIKMVIATSPTTVTVFFSEQLETDPKVLVVSSASFTFDLSLTVVDIDEIGADFIILRTSAQDEGQLYHLTLNNATLEDLACNKLVVPVTVAMIGFTATLPANPAQLLNMYNFILQSIRDEDQKNGGQFIQRLFMGPQAFWEQTTERILAIPDIWNLDKVPNDLLQYVKNIVGWTDKLNSITSRLTPAALRRLISISVTFWKQRGVEDIIEDILRMVTGTNVRVLNWFWYRWILGETALGEDHNGLDPWLLSTPGEGPDAYTYAVRIVDNGLLDYQLITSLLKLTRPVGERVEVDYVAFSDLFLADNNKAQWADFSGLSTVIGGMLHLLDTAIEEDTEAVFNNGINTSNDWSNLVATWRIRGTGVYFVDAYRQDVVGGANAYRLDVNVGANILTLKLLTAGVPATLGSYFIGPTTPFWQGAIAVTVFANGVISKSTGTSAWDAGAYGGSLAGDGSVYFTTEESTTVKMAGLSHSPGVPDITTFDYAFAFQPTAVLQTYDGAYTSIGTYAANDIFRIEVAGGGVLFYQNGTLVYTSVVPPLHPMSFMAAFFTPNGTISQPVFDPPMPPEMLQPNIFYTLRVAVTPLLPGSATNQITVYWEASQVIQAQDLALDHGTLAMGHYSGGSMEVSEVEMFLNPMRSDFIDINS